MHIDRSRYRKIIYSPGQKKPGKVFFLCERGYIVCLLVGCGKELAYSLIFYSTLVAVSIYIFFPFHQISRNIDFCCFRHVTDERAKGRDH